MAKKKRKEKAPLQAFDPRDYYANSYIEENASKKTGQLIHMPGSDDLIVGLPIPFPIQFVLNASVLQLGIIMEIDGPPESCKTSLMYEIGSWFAAANGWLKMILTESKVSRKLAKSLIGYDYQSQQAFYVESAASLDEMEHISISELDKLKTLMQMKNPETGKPVGLTFPVAIGIDSIMGANTDESNSKIIKDGYVKRDFPGEALSINKYVKMFAGQIQTFPILLVLINHRKVAKKDPTKPYQQAEFTKAGGKAIQFQETYNLVAEGVSQAEEVDHSADGGFEVHRRTIRLTNGKNSLGTNRRSIEVEMSWRTKMVRIKRVDGSVVQQQRQITKWHWEECATKLLYDYRNKPRSRETKADAEVRRKKFDRVLHIAKVTKPRTGYWSRTLGMTSDDAVSAEEFGALVMSNQDVIEALQNHFGFQQGVQWVGGGEDYYKVYRKIIVDSAKARQKAKAERLEEEIEFVSQYDDDSMDSSSGDLPEYVLEDFEEDLDDDLRSA